MFWFWGLLLVTIVVWAGRAHSRYLDRLERQSDEAWYVLLSGHARTAIGSDCQVDPGSQRLLLTPASSTNADSITLTFAQSDMSATQGRIRLPGKLQFEMGDSQSGRSGSI
jgi:hypothetical protein